jgi:hypothetical protein
MSQTTQDLWPEDIAVVSDLKPPLTILREQASLLGNKTNNLVEGEVRSYNMGNGILSHSFLVTSPIFNYSYSLFTVMHSAEFYPVDFVDDSNIVLESVNSEEAFVDKLRSIFASEKTRKVVSALIAQAQGSVAV